MKPYLISVFACAAASLTSQLPFPAFADDPPPLQSVGAVAASPRHRAENIVIESLDLDSDYSIFMEPGCPEPVRRKALRRLWSLWSKFPPAENGSPWN